LVSRLPAKRQYLYAEAALIRSLLTWHCRKWCPKPTLGDVASTFHSCSTDVCRFRTMSLDHASKRIRVKGYSITAWSRIYLQSADQKNVLEKGGNPAGDDPAKKSSPSNSTSPLKQPLCSNPQSAELNTYSLVAMPQATETAIIHLKPDSNFEDTSSPAAAQLRKCLDIVAAQKGCQRQYYGRQLEDPSLFIWSIGPQSLATEREPTAGAA
jgi:hypothetical protein